MDEFYENVIDWNVAAPWVAAEELLQRSEIRPSSVDLFYPYEVYTATALSHLEANGFCGAGEGDSLDTEDRILRLNGRTVVSTSGGRLSHGRMGVSNYYTEEVKQLRGSVEPERQVARASTAPCSVGSFFPRPCGARHAQRRRLADDRTRRSAGAAAG